MGRKWHKQCLKCGKCLEFLVFLVIFGVRLGKERPYTTGKAGLSFVAKRNIMK